MLALERLLISITNHGSIESNEEKSPLLRRYIAGMTKIEKYNRTIYQYEYDGEMFINCYKIIQ